MVHESTAANDGPDGGITAVVISGAGARGAYESGVLAELLPALFPQGLGSVVLLGTSAGAINAALWASRARPGRSLHEVGEEVCNVWVEFDQRKVFAPLPRTAFNILKHFLPPFTGFGNVLSLLDTTPLVENAEQTLNEAHIADNVEQGALAGIGVVATSCPLDGSGGRSK